MSHPRILLFCLLAFLLVACGGSVGLPQQAVQDYLQAIVSTDETGAVNAACAEWEQQAVRESAAYQGVQTQLENLDCSLLSQDGDSALVSCTGQVRYSYAGGEDQIDDLAGRVFSAKLEGGEWKVCGLASEGTANPIEVTAPETAVAQQLAANTSPPIEVSTPASSPTPDTRPLPESWSSWPVLPIMSERARQIYQRGLEMGNDPQVFSIIGDCQSVPSVFLGIYATDRYFLGDGFEYLQQTIDQFAGNFDRDHITVKNGLSVASVLSPFWADASVCAQNETPLECEFRLHRPSIVFINLGTNWKNSSSAAHEKYMRQIVDFVIAHGAVPILSTKGDDQEGDNTINLSIARIAYEYDIPLWNFWGAIQDLPHHGLGEVREDSNYLSVEAWNRRSFTGLRTLDRVWRFVASQT